MIAGENGAYTIEGTVVGVNARSFLVKDDTGIILIYLGWDNTTETPVVSYNATVGQKVKVSGTTTTYIKLKQFSETGLTIEKLRTVPIRNPRLRFWTVQVSMRMRPLRLS